MSKIKETLCDNCFDVSSLDEEFFDGMCFPCYKEVESSWRNIDLDNMHSRMADAEMGDL